MSCCCRRRWSGPMAAACISVSRSDPVGKGTRRKKCKRERESQKEEIGVGRTGCVWWDQKESCMGVRKEDDDGQGCGWLVRRRASFTLARTRNPRSHWGRGGSARGGGIQAATGGSVFVPQRGKEKMGCEDAGMGTNQRWTRRCCGLLAGCESSDHASRSEGRASGVSTAA